MPSFEAPHFAANGCPRLGPYTGVVWPASYKVVVAPDGRHTLVTADGTAIPEGAMVIGGGAAQTTNAKAGMACIVEGTTLTLIESTLTVTSK